MALATPRYRDGTLIHVAAVNGRLADESRIVVSSEVLGKLRTRIKRLLDKLRELCKAVRAESFSITVGATWPPHVDVSVTFAAK